MRDFRKITASVLTATLILSALPFTVFADEVPETETDVTSETEYVDAENEGLEVVIDEAEETTVEVIDESENAIDETDVTIDEAVAESEEESLGETSEETAEAEVEAEAETVGTEVAEETAGENVEENAAEEMPVEAEEIAVEAGEEFGVEDLPAIPEASSVSGFTAYSMPLGLTASKPKITDIKLQVKQKDIATVFDSYYTEYQAQVKLTNAFSVYSSSQYIIDKENPYGTLLFRVGGTNGYTLSNGSERFVTSREYVLRLWLKAEDGYVFTSNVSELKLTINGCSCKVLDGTMYLAGENSLELFVSISDLYMTEICLSFDDNGFYSVFDTSHYEFDADAKLKNSFAIDDYAEKCFVDKSCTHLFYTDSSVDDPIFADSGFVTTDKTYIAQIWVEANKAYAFTTNINRLSVYINGESCDVLDEFTKYDSEYGAWKVFIAVPFRMEEIHLSISESVFDEVIDSSLSVGEAEASLLRAFSLDDYSKYYIDINCSNLLIANINNELTYVSKTSMMSEDNEYALSIWVEAKDNYDFITDFNKLKVFINGTRVELFEDTYYDDYWDAWVIYVRVAPVLTNQGVEGFVNRCYTAILGRNPDAVGKENWINALNNGTNCGAQVAYGFIFSQEYKNKNKTNTEFVTDLYTMFFGRKPDSAGLNNWLNQLNAGVMSREQVFASFAKSTEFKNICSSYGILQGCYIPGYSTASQTQVNLFVYRLYNTCLGRNADIGGLENWSRNILAGNTSGYSAALGFFTSAEYKNLNKSNEEFIKDLYLVMMDRNADSAGLRNWVNQLTVYSREEVIKMFCKSQEYRNICARYGINVGV